MLPELWRLLTWLMVLQCQVGPCLARLQCLMRLQKALCTGCMSGLPIESSQSQYERPKKKSQWNHSFPLCGQIAASHQTWLLVQRVTTHGWVCSTCGNHGSVEKPDPLKIKQSWYRQWSNKKFVQRTNRGLGGGGRYFSNKGEIKAGCLVLFSLLQLWSNISDQYLYLGQTRILAGKLLKR